MTAEFQVPSPIVPTRDNYFVRYCKQHADGMWAVVDVSLDTLHPGAVPRSRRRPSGCLIQELPNGYSKVLKKFLDHPSARVIAMIHLIDFFPRSYGSSM